MEMTQAELKQILDDHDLWLDSKGKSGKQADLRGQDLTHFFGATLRSANLKVC